MSRILSAFRDVLADLAHLETPTIAAALAAVIAPIAVALAGVHVTAAELAGWLVIAGGVAATLQKLLAPKPPAPAPKPAPAKAKKSA